MGGVETCSETDAFFDGDSGRGRRGSGSADLDRVASRGGVVGG